MRCRNHRPREFRSGGLDPLLCMAGIDSPAEVVTGVFGSGIQLAAYCLFTLALSAQPSTQQMVGLSIASMEYQAGWTRATRVPG